MDITKESPVILSLCTGLLRGLEVGIEHALQQQIRVAAYAEIEAFIVSNLLAGMEKGALPTAPIWTDLKTFPYEEFHGRVHGIIGGYPCQPFSVAGNQKGTEDPRHLWPYIKDGIAAVRPVFCFFENVRGHLNLGYEQVRRELQELGYEVREGIYSAEEVGAPHRRDRLFILAIKRDQLENSDNPGSGAPKCDTKSYRTESCEEWKHSQYGVSGSSENVGNTNSSPATYEVSAGRSELGIPGEEMAYSIGERHGRRGDFDLSYSEWSGSENIRQYRNDIRSEASGCSQGFMGWPARPGQDQRSFEHPRTTQSGLGITIDGYNYRGDLLRGAGNGVV